MTQFENFENGFSNFGAMATKANFKAKKADPLEKAWKKKQPKQRRGFGINLSLSFAGHGWSTSFIIYFICILLHGINPKNNGDLKRFIFEN